MEDELKKARNLAFRLLKYRDRSEKEISDRLGKKGIHSSLIKKIVEELRGLSLLDDEKFSCTWIRKRLKEGYGFLRIERELREKGIDAELIRNLLERFRKEQDNFFKIKELVEKYRKRKFKDKDTFKRKLISYLLRRGFSWDEVSQVLEGLEDEY